MKNKILILSIGINIGLLIFCCFKTKIFKTKISTNPVSNIDTVSYDIESMRNFETVFISRNDSIYKSIWNEAFENEPEKAFLISCSYYYVTKDKRILKNIEMSILQLQDVYQRKFKIDSLNYLRKKK